MELHDTVFYKHERQIHPKGYVPFPENEHSIIEKLILYLTEIPSPFFESFLYFSQGHIHLAWLG